MKLYGAKSSIKIDEKYVWHWLLIRHNKISLWF